MLDKLEDFLFDIIGLALPGLITIFLIWLLPILVLPISEIQNLYTNNSVVLSNLFKFYENDKTIFYAFILITGYILGHTIKVLSKYPYSLFKVIFDNGINKLLNFIFYILGKIVLGLLALLKKIPGINKVFTKNKNISLLSYLFNKGYRTDCRKKIKEEKVKLRSKAILDFFIELYNFFYYLMQSIFTFETASYYRENDKLIGDVISKINKRLKTDYPSTWYSIYKLSNVIMEQENIKSLSKRFLAKYNFYRSLSFMFLINFIYIIFFFNYFNKIISNTGNNIYWIIMGVNFLLWYTFHEKFKRYWTLCGNESLISLFYFISKSEDANIKEENIE